MEYQAFFVTLFQEKADPPSRRCDDNDIVQFLLKVKGYDEHIHVNTEEED